jgi:hypothetical protein
MWGTYDLHILNSAEGAAKRSIATSILFKDVEPGASYEPVLRVNPEEAEQLMTELWNSGVRPKNIQNLSGELNAVKYHLEDMRKLAKVL